MICTFICDTFVIVISDFLFSFRFDISFVIFLFCFALHGHRNIDPPKVLGLMLDEHFKEKQNKTKGCLVSKDRMKNTSSKMKPEVFGDRCYTRFLPQKN